ncbi:acylneuraminate cytidylyltransferase family protein [Patescibacteria group bacterium]|nr:MAG: acylneuraminate cytidylyltransferase family protein [Patescibacteria group bacterium]
MNVLGVITARGGSKSVPKKNIRPMAGKPLLAHTIEQAKGSARLTRVILSTDDPEIAAVGREWGVEAPFIRPAEFALDRTPDLPVFVHALNWLKVNEGYFPDVVVHLRPTSPGRTSGMIDEAVDLLLAHPEADCVRGVALPHDNPFKMWTIGNDGYLKPLLAVPGVAEPYNAPRQALPEVWYQLGYVDAIWPKTILEKNSMTGSRVYPLRLQVAEYTDIDSLFDWRVAEMYLEEQQKKTGNAG